MRLQKLEFDGLGSEEKEKKQEKPISKEKEEKKRMKGILVGAKLSGDDLTALGFTPGPEMGKVLAAIEAAVRTGEELRLDASDDVRVELTRRIADARAALGGAA